MDSWTPEEQRILKPLQSPARIQRFLDDLPYDIREGARSPRVTMRDNTAHCMGGALFAAAALEELGHSARLVFLNAVHDDGHCIAVYQRDNHWGALAKSNTVLLRSRDPVYNSIRELAMSYFDFYFNTEGEKTLRGYTKPLHLDRFNGWKFDERPLTGIEDALDRAEEFPVVKASVARRLPHATRAVQDACFLGANREGLYQGRKIAR